MPQKDQFGRHELLDRSSLLLENVAAWILEHEGLKADERKIADEAFDALFRLYQLLGSKTLQPKKTEGKKKKR